MGRIMAIDYGTKRTGVAVTDPFRIIASPLETIHSKDLVAFFTKYFQQEIVDVLVVGEPKRLNGEQGKIGLIIDEIVVHLNRKFKDIEIVRVDERFTSMIATQSFNMMKAKKVVKRDKGIIDRMSAAIILQTYMDTLS
jgi:putative Holliday junction resolvase